MAKPRSIPDTAPRACRDGRHDWSDAGVCRRPGCGRVRQVRGAAPAPAPAPAPGAAPAPAPTAEAINPATGGLAGPERDRLRALLGLPAEPAAPGAAPGGALPPHRQKAHKLWGRIGRRAADVAVVGCEAICERGFGPFGPREPDEPEAEDVDELRDAVADQFKESFGERELRPWHRIVLVLLVMLLTMYICGKPVRRARPEPQPEPQPQPPERAPLRPVPPESTA